MKKNKIKFKCPKCGEFAESNDKKYKNIISYNFVCPKCNIGCVWIYDEKE